MVHHEAEYKEAAQRVQSKREQLDRHRESLAQQGFQGQVLERLMDPLMAFHLQLQEEVESYERLKRGELGGELTSLRGLGHTLICLRIAADVSQAELANRLEVDPSQVSRDERNEYHGITIDRAAKIIGPRRSSMRWGPGCNCASSWRSARRRGRSTSGLVPNSLGLQGGDRMTSIR